MHSRARVSLRNEAKRKGRHTGEFSGVEWNSIESAGMQLGVWKGTTAGLVVDDDVCLV